MLSLKDSKYKDETFTAGTLSLTLASHNANPIGRDLEGRARQKTLNNLKKSAN